MKKKSVQFVQRQIAGLYKMIVIIRIHALTVMNVSMIVGERKILFCLLTAKLIMSSKVFGNRFNV